MVALIAYRTADLAVRVLPEPLANRLALGLARLAFALHLPARRCLEANLQRMRFAAPRRPEDADIPARGNADARPPAAQRAFEYFALSLVDSLRLERLERGALAARIEVRGAEHLARAREAGNGVILLSAHAGNWEWGAAYLASLGERIHVAARPHRSRWVEGLFGRLRGRWGVSILRGQPLWLAASQALRRREWVALMGDRGARPGQPGRVPAGSVCAWAAALARRTGALILPAVMLRLDHGRYAACFQPPLSATACLEGGYREAMRRGLEAQPAQWLAFEPLPEGLA
jgi:lauroyl/myristoyl acyltransferase